MLWQRKAYIGGFSPFRVEKLREAVMRGIKFRRFSARRIFLNIPVGNISRLQGISQATPISLAAGKFHRAARAQYPKCQSMMLPSIALIEMRGYLSSLKSS